ncbi:hypothetical protein BB561_004173 [Smittium simulii]|uniref:Transcription initiation factor TFIID subunit 4 n=1 Tax=Smittium simulii TaxID=133385 RepID=A0A2T9YHP8_9FUNG|nr:hypothetical protein BB561_004173 [Smittium simulii]
MNPNNNSSKNTSADEKSSEIDKLISSISSQPNVNSIDNIDFDALLGSVGIVSQNHNKAFLSQNNFNLSFDENKKPPNNSNQELQNSQANRDIFNINELEKVIAEAQRSLSSNITPSENIQPLSAITSNPLLSKPIESINSQSINPSSNSPFTPIPNKLNPSSSTFNSPTGLINPSTNNFVPDKNLIRLNSSNQNLLENLHTPSNVIADNILKNKPPNNIVPSDAQNFLSNQQNLLLNHSRANHLFFSPNVQQSSAKQNVYQQPAFQTSNDSTPTSSINMNYKSNSPIPRQPFQQQPRSNLSRVASNSSIAIPKVDGVPAHEHIARLMSRLPHAKQLQLSQFLAQLRQNKITTKNFIDLATSILGDDLTELLESLFNKPSKQKFASSSNSLSTSSPLVSVTPNSSQSRPDASEKFQNTTSLNSPNKANVDSSTKLAQQSSIFSNISLHNQNIKSNTISDSDNMLGISYNSSKPDSSKSTHQHFFSNSNEFVANNLVNIPNHFQLDSDLKAFNAETLSLEELTSLKMSLNPLKEISNGINLDLSSSAMKNYTDSFSLSAKLQSSNHFNDTTNSSITSNKMELSSSQGKADELALHNLSNNNNKSAIDKNINQNIFKPNKSSNNLSVQQLSNLDRLEVIVRGEQHSLESLINLSRYLAIHGEDIVNARGPNEPELKPADLTSRLIRVQKIQSQIAQKQLILQQHLKQKNKQDQLKSSQEFKNSPKVNEIIEIIQNAASRDSSSQAKLDGIDINKDLVPMLKKLSKYKLSKLAKSGNDINCIIREYKKQVLKENRLKGLTVKSTKDSLLNSENMNKSTPLESSIGNSSPAFSTQSDLGGNNKNIKSNKTSSSNLLDSVSGGHVKKVKEEQIGSPTSYTNDSPGFENVDQSSKGIKRHISSDQSLSDNKKNKLGVSQISKKHKSNLNSSSASFTQKNIDNLKSSSFSKTSSYQTPNTNKASKNAAIPVNSASTESNSGVNDSSTFNTTSTTVGSSQQPIKTDDAGAGSKSIDDVMSMAGIDLREERQNILLSSFAYNNSNLDERDDGSKKNSEENAVFTSVIKKVSIIKDSNYKPTFLDETSLDNLVSTIAERNGISTVGVAVTGLLSESINIRITSLIKAMITAAYHRNRTQTFPPPRLNTDTNLPFYRIQPKLDVRKQLAALEKVDKNRERKYLESLLMGETPLMTGVDKNKDNLESNKPAAGNSVANSGQTPVSVNNTNATTLSDKIPSAVNTDLGKPENSTIKGNSSSSTTAKVSAASGKRKRTSNVNQGMISQLSSNKLSLAYAAVSGSGGSGSMLSARNMPDEVRSKITNQTALMSVGGVRKSWMLPGSLSTGWQNPSSSLRVSSHNARSGNDYKYGKLANTATNTESGIINESEESRNLKTSKNTLSAVGNDNSSNLDTNLATSSASNTIGNNNSKKNRHSLKAQGDELKYSDNNRKSSSQSLNQFQSVWITRNQNVSITLRDGLYCLEQERELARKELGQGSNSGFLNKGSSRLISGNSSAGIAILIKAYSLFQKD